MRAPSIGPLLSATVLGGDLDAALSGYIDELGLCLQVDTPLPASEATELGLGELAGQRRCWLASASASPWLRLIHCPVAVPQSPMQRHGWLALEVLTADCDALVAGLGPRWQVLGAPADLDISPHIRATQVLGPCGELYYFTQVKQPLPPFDLPQTAERIAQPFIAVMTTTDREATTRAWEAAANSSGWRFDTRISVLNRALGRPLAQPYPVALVPAAEQSFIEIDEVQLDATADSESASAINRTARFAADRHFAGLHLVSIANSSLSKGSRQLASMGHSTKVEWVGSG